MQTCYMVDWNEVALLAMKTMNFNTKFHGMSFHIIQTSLKHHVKSYLIVI